MHAFYIYAVCLDGSPPGYHFQRGFGSGSRSWIVYLQVTDPFIFLFQLQFGTYVLIPKKITYYVFMNVRLDNNPMFCTVAFFRDRTVRPVLMFCTVPES